MARLMRAMGLQDAVRGKTILTTILDPAAACPLDWAVPARGPLPRSGTGRMAEGNWFNTRRLLKPSGNIPPAEAEARYYAQAKVQALAA